MAAPWPPPRPDQLPRAPFRGPRGYPPGQSVVAPDAAARPELPSVFPVAAVVGAVVATAVIAVFLVVLWWLVWLE